MCSPPNGSNTTVVWKSAVTKRSASNLGRSSSSRSRRSSPRSPRQADSSFFRVVLERIPVAS
eukprot:3283535-Pyramimonas_sp.AAC.1